MDWIGYGAKQRSKRGGSGVGRKGIVASVDRASGEGRSPSQCRLLLEFFPSSSASLGFEFFFFHADLLFC